MSYGKYFIRFLRIFVRTKSDHTKMFYFLRQFENYYNVKKKEKKKEEVQERVRGGTRNKNKKRKKEKTDGRGENQERKEMVRRRKREIQERKEMGGKKKGGDREEDGDVDDGATDTNYPLENQNQKQKIAERMLRKLVATSR